MITDDLYTVLCAADGVTALLDNTTAIYPAGETPQDLEAGNAYVVFQVISSQPTQSRDGESGLATMRIQIDSYAASFEAAWAIADQIRLAINKHHDTFGSASGVTVIMDDSSDGQEQPGIGEEFGAGRVIQDYILWFQQTVPS